MDGTLDVRIPRRDFLRTVGAVAAAAVTPAALLPRPAAADRLRHLPETLAARLHRSLRGVDLPGMRHPANSPLRHEVHSGGGVSRCRIGDLKAGQQALVREVIRGTTSSSGFRRFMQQMRDDSGGLHNYYIGFLGRPGEAGFQLVITGHHFTHRIDGNFADRIAFGGPIFYGHTEELRPRKNLFYFQTRSMNRVFAALDATQRKAALLDWMPREGDIRFRSGSFPGMPLRSLSPDQYRLFEDALADLLRPYCARQAREVLRSIEAHGGTGKIHLSFYRNHDLGRDGEWDNWRLEGPGFIWSFRGAPHVHCYINIAAPPRRKVAELDDEWEPESGKR